MKKTYSRVMASVHRTAEGLAGAGVMSEQAMREFDESGRIRMAGTEARPVTPARKALLVFVEAWTYPIRGNEDVPVSTRLFEARALAKDVAASAADPPEFTGWLDILRDEARENSLEWEDTLHAVTDYFGLSTDM